MVDAKEDSDDYDEDDLVTDIDTMVSAVKSPPPPPPPPPPPKHPSSSKIAILTKQLALECEDLLPPPPGFGEVAAAKIPAEEGRPVTAHPPLVGYHAELLQSALVSTADNFSPPPKAIANSNHLTFCLHFQSVKQLSAQLQNELSGFLGFWPQQIVGQSTTSTDASRVQEATAPAPQSKGTEAIGATESTEGRPLLRSQNSIALLQKRQSRLSNLYRSTSSTGNGSLQADPVLDAPPPPTINVYAVPPLWTPPIAYIDPPWTLTLKKEVSTCTSHFRESNLFQSI